MSEQNNKLESWSKSPETVAAEHNLQMLNVDMLNLLNQESVGGNAGKSNIGGKEYPLWGSQWFC